MRNNTYNQIKFFVGKFGNSVLVEYPEETEDNYGLIEALLEDYCECGDVTIFENLPIGLYSGEYIMCDDRDQYHEYNDWDWWGEIINIKPLKFNLIHEDNNQ